MAALSRSPAFSSGVAYAVSCLGQQDIVMKEKQSEAINSIYEGKVVFPWLLTGYRVRKIAALPAYFSVLTSSWDVLELSPLRGALLLWFLPSCR